MKVSPVVDGSWTHEKGDQYIVTGVDRDGKRFKKVYDGWLWANGINVWQGSKWLQRGGKRYLIQRIYN